MGAGKRHRQAFFRQHPRCCLCGGESVATTIDHIPLRAAFSRNIGPQGFEFPACIECNRGTSGSEQVFALYVRLMDHTDENYDQAHIRALIQGVRNNYRDLLPRTDLPASEKRRVLRHFGWAKARGDFLDDVGIVAVPKVVGAHIEMNALKLLAALHYRHMGEALTHEIGVFSGWSQQGLPGVDEAQDLLFEGMPALVIGARVNTSIGDQFAYRWGRNPAEGLFGFGAGFGTGLFVFAASAPWKIVDGKEYWTRFAPPRSPAA